MNHLSKDHCLEVTALANEKSDGKEMRLPSILITLLPVVTLGINENVLLLGTYT